MSDVWQILWGVWADILKNSVADGLDGASLIYSAACIYLMFYLYHCQVCTEIYPIPLSAETVDACLDVGSTILDRFNICTVVDVFESMVRHHCIRICLHDGLQYIPQDRVGNPLSMTKKIKEKKSSSLSVYLDETETPDTD